MSAPMPGLCSVTFRERRVEEVLELASAAGLECIEWGGDLHVPHGELEVAASVARLTEAAGMAVCSYGSYLFADDTAAAVVSAVLDTTEALGAPAVRVWAPFGTEPGCPPGEVARVGEVLESVCSQAQRRGLQVYLEFHGATLTATAASAKDLLDHTNAENLLCAWQPPYWNPRPAELEIVDMELLADHLAHLHVYSWLPDGTREPLVSQRDRWPSRLRAASAIPEVPGLRRAALLEFVAGDDPRTFAADAEQLRTWLAQLDAQPLGGSSSAGANASEAHSGSVA